MSALFSGVLRHLRHGPAPRASPAAVLRRSPSAPRRAIKAKGGEGRMPPVASDVRLTEEERRLFDTLLAAARHAQMDVTLRCAGGWVRDKLLGMESGDIDIALDGMLGREFADKVNDYLRSNEETEQRIAVIHSNPDQSKHLETARMKVHDMVIDLVNLRSETYTQDSRIPEMTMGGPEDDAMRRDLTINSLFYNINMGAVEDFTGQGLDDLKAGRIRTPLPPTETFMDDPLRVLRAVRFCARLNFELDESLKEAASSETVRTALRDKVSRERIGEELKGMFNGPDPVLAMRHLSNLGLLRAVFDLPAQSAIGDGWGAQCVQTMEAGQQMLRSLESKSRWNVSDDEKRILLLSAFLLPLRKAKGAAPKKRKGKGQTQAVVWAMIRDGIKWRNQDADDAVALHDAAPELLHQLALLRRQGSTDAAQSSGAEDSSDDVRVALGMVVKKIKHLWRVGVCLSSLLPMPEALPLGVDPAEARDDVPDVCRELTQASGQEALDKRLADFEELESAICGFKLANAYEWKSPMDGREVMEALGIQIAGPAMKPWMDAIVRWHLAHPDGTKEECRDFILKRQASQRDNEQSRQGT